MDSNGSRENNHIRRYGSSTNTDTVKLAVLIASALIILVGVIVFIMSLAGTGLFRVPSEDGGDIPPVGGSDSTAADSEPDGSTVTTGGTDTPESYIDKGLDDVKKGLLILLDDSHEYKFPEQDGLVDLYSNKSSVYSIKNTTLRIEKETVVALNAMLNAYKEATGFEDAVVWTAYRSYEDQNNIYSNSTGGSAKPGCSDYHLGTSVMLNAYIDGIKHEFDSPTANPMSAWVLQNMHKYGFIMRYPTEKTGVTGFDNMWQIRYVGIPHATYMKNNNLCLEEYLELLRTSHKVGEAPLTVDCKADGGDVYEIFYAEAAAEGITRISLPSGVDTEYSVSGDNIGGFIVTVVTEKAQGTQANN